MAYVHGLAGFLSEPTVVLNDDLDQQAPQEEIITLPDEEPKENSMKELMVAAGLGLIIGLLISNLIQQN